MPRIFISYRREDSAGHAGRLFDHLKPRFGKERVFMDVAGIEPGIRSGGGLWLSPSLLSSANSG